MNRMISFFTILFCSFILSSCFEKLNVENIDLKCVVSFVTEAPITLDDLVISKGGKIEKPLIQKYGYLFEGWFMDDKHEVPFDFNVEVNADIILYAKWSIDESVNIPAIEVKSYQELIKKAEIVKLLKDMKEGSTTENKYKISGKIANILSIQDGIFQIFIDGNNDSPIFVKGVTNNFKNLNLENDDYFTIEGFFVIDNQTLCLSNAKIDETSIVKHPTYVFVIIDNDVDHPLMYSINEYPTLYSIPIPNKDGFIFNGWYNNQYYENKLPDNYQFDKTINIYAYFIALTEHTIIMHIDHEEEIINFYGELEITELNIPISNEYVFEGWYFDCDYKIQVPIDYTFSSDETIYAKLKEIVYYNVSLKIESDVSIIKVKVGTSLNDYDIPMPSKVDYAFEGWYLEETNVLFNFDELIDRDTIIFAKFTYIEKTFTITKIINEEEHIISLHENATLASLGVIKIDDYLFDGWYYDEDFQYPLSNDFLLKCDIIVYAKLTLIPYCFININIDGTSTEYKIISGTTLVSNNIIAPIKNDYTFDGWYLDENFEINLPINAVITTNLLIYAKYNKIPYFDVNIIVDGNIVSTISIKKGTSITKIPKPNKLEDQFGQYTFSNWYFDHEFSQLISSNFLIDSEIDLYAKFNIKKYYYIKVYYYYMDELTFKEYKLLEGNNNINKISPPLTYTYNNNLYEFDSWYFDLEYINSLPVNYVFNESMTIYAKEKITPFIKVNLVILGETTQILIEPKKNISTIQIPSHPGYSFSNWFYDSTFTTSVPLNYVPTSEITIYGKYLKNIDVITNIDGVETIYHLKEGYNLASIPNPIKIGYTFLGWYSDTEFKNRIENTFIVTEDLTLYPLFTNVYITVSCILDPIIYFSNGIPIYQKINTVIIEQGKDFTSIINPSTIGYTFEGWYYDYDYEMPFSLNSIVSEDIIIFAKFIPHTNIMYTINHWIEDIGISQYTLKDTEIFYGTTDEIVIPNLKNYEGYDQPENIPIIKVSGNGKSLVDIFYTRSKFTIKYFIDNFVYLESEPIKHGFEMNLLKTTDFNGYFFRNWYLDKELTILNDIKNMPIGGINLYADCEKIVEGTSGLVYDLSIDGLSYYVLSYIGGSESVFIPNGYNNLPITKVLPDAFRDNKIVKDIIIDKYVTEIGSNAFDGCVNLETIILPENLEVINEYAFKDCINLKEINLSSSLERISESLFVNCISLNEINIDESNLHYRSINGVLYSKDLKELIAYPANKEGELFNVPEGVEIIKSDAFSSAKIQSILLPSSLSIIRTRAFFNANKLDIIYIPRNVVKISDDVFSGCINLIDIDVSIDNQHFSSINGVLYNKLQTSLICYPNGKTLQEFDIPITVKIIEYKAFNSCEYLEIIHLRSILGIDYLGFYSCQNLIVYVDSETLKWNPLWCFEVKEVIYS